jgi:hypothetical protein
LIGERLFNFMMGNERVSLYRLLRIISHGSYRGL